MHRRAILYALASAALFGLSTPTAKVLLGTIHPAILAGLLYSGAGVGVGLLRRLGPRVFGPKARQICQFGLMITSGRTTPNVYSMKVMRSTASIACSTRRGEYSIWSGKCGAEVMVHAGVVADIFTGL